MIARTTNDELKEELLKKIYIYSRDPQRTNAAGYWDGYTRMK